MIKKYRKKRWWLKQSILLIMICMLTGCSSKQKETVEITLIHGFGTSEDTHVAMRQIYKNFEKEYPEIKINMISMPSSEEVVKKAGDLLTVGEVPDVIFTAGEGRHTLYEYMIEHDYAVDLMPYIKKDERFLGNISPVILEQWITDKGELYTVSDVLFMVGYWYNCRIFEEAGISELPKTWEQLKDICEKLESLNREKEDYLIRPMILDTAHVVYLGNLLLHEDNDLEREELRRAFVDVKSETFKKVSAKLEEMGEYIDFINADSFRDSLEAFNNEKTAMYINGVWATYLIDQNLDVAYAPFPSENGESVSMISSCVGYLLGNSKDQKRIDASIEFLKYMLSEPVAQRILKETGQIPSNPNIEVDVEIANGRLHHAVSSIKNAEKIIEVPANIWSLEEQKIFFDKMLELKE